MIISFLVFAFFYVSSTKTDAQEIKLPEVLSGIKTMVLVKAGTFMMGDAKSNFADEKPEHSVSLKAFYMDETPVTYADFEKYVADA